MKIGIFGKLALLSLSAWVLSPLCVAQSTIAGDWKGMVDHGDSQTHVILHIVAEKDGTLIASVDAIEMEASDVPASAVVLKDSKLTFSIDAAPGTYEGTVNKDVTEIKGTWTQDGQGHELNFTRVPAPTPAATPVPASAPDKPATPPPMVR
jgi:hypothetical protein